ncbi:MAG: glycerol kinase [Myxococcales bacterium]|nr:glycerol kinase [Myxococcales bacterium]|tara:strand:- start:1019 stop:2497 length:1479 start_codon:yes stop_codon:yes gene_type:complete
MSKYVMAIDQGTTGTTVLILDHSLAVLGRHTVEFAQIYPQPGWVEHEPAAIWESVVAAVGGAVAHAGIATDQIAGIGITNQRETAVIWDRETGDSIHNAIVWQCRRTAGVCQTLTQDGHGDFIRERTGLVIDAYFAGTKAAWLLDNVPGARQRAAKGELAFGTIDSFLVWKLTSGQSHVTDVSNACRTMLMNLHTRQWDDELLKLLQVPKSVLPEIRTCSEVYGTTIGFPGLPDGIPVAGMAGDQQSALFGQACFGLGEAKCTYGTGAFLLMNTGDQAVPSQNGLLTTVGWQIGDEVTYALEGSAFIAGAAVQWLRDGLELIESAPEVEALAKQVDDTGGVYFVPALTGLGTPHWRPDARGLITGLTRGTTKAHIARATLEGIAFQNYDILDAMSQDLNRPLTQLKVDGGAAANDLLMQFQADLLGVELVRPTMLETTALGAAFLAGLAVGVWADLSAVKDAWQENARFQRTMSEGEVACALTGWRTAVEKS